MSANAAGTDAGNADSGGVVATGSVAFSPDGTTIAFESQASDLGPHDSNGSLDVYLRDLTSGTTTLVSENAAGTDSGNFTSITPVFSPDGTKLAFWSGATDLGPTDTNGSFDLYMRDLAAGTTSLVTIDPGGGGDPRGSSGAVFSPDGSQLAFIGGEGRDLYLRDLATGTTRLISGNAGGTGGGNGVTWEAAFSPDGSKIAFASEATDLGPPVPAAGITPYSYVYLRDLATETTGLVSINAEGTLGIPGWSPSFTADGHHIVFQTTWPGFGPTDTNGAQDVYARDIVAGTTALVSANASGTDSGSSASWDPITSPSGSRVLFTSSASDLVPGSPDPPHTDTDTDVYLRDLTTGVSEMVSIDAEGRADADTQGGSRWPVFSPDGTKVAFTSVVGNFGPADPRRPGGGFYDPDVYVRDLRKGVTTLVSTRADGTRSANDGSREVAAFSPDGTQVAFVSLASDLGATDTNGAFDVYVATLHGADLSLAGQSSHGTYRLDINNDGPDSAEGPVLHALLPDGTELADATTTAGSCGPADPDTPKIVACHLPTLAPDDTVVVTITVDVTAPPGTALTLHARTESPTVDTDYRNNNTTLTFTAP